MFVLFFILFAARKKFYIVLFLCYMLFNKLVFKMAFNDQNRIEDLDEEVRELLENYKHKKSSAYEPCTLKNLRECLIGLSEEFGILNISYIFNPYVDVDNNTLRPEALVKLINSVWTLLHYHKNLREKSDTLAERTHILEHNNKLLNGLVGKLKEKVSSEKNEAKACVASAQRIADNSDVMLQKLTESHAKYLQLSKQKESSERCLRNEIARMKLQNEKLQDRLRHKNSNMTFNEDYDNTLSGFKEREKQQRAVITKLQRSNQELLHQVLDMKNELILGGLQHFKFEDKNK